MPQATPLQSQPINTKYDSPIKSAYPSIAEAEKLTEREREVLNWIAQGKTNREIGIILGISPRTVAKHVEHIFGKLGIENRVLLAVQFATQ